MDRITSPSSVSALGTYEIDSSHSSAQFSVKHLMISNVRGEFSKVSGSVVYDPTDPAATKIDAVIDATTINTREEKRDAHLKSSDFFEYLIISDVDVQQQAGAGIEWQTPGERRPDDARSHPRSRVEY